MNTNKILLLAFMSGGAAFGSTETPTQYKLECWDHTFAYNRLEVEKKDGAFHFKASGQSVVVFKNLVELTENENWGEIFIEFDIPESQCQTSDSDPKLLFCNANTLNIAVRGHTNSRAIDQKTVHREVWIKTKKVETIGQRKLLTTGYELDIKSGFNRADPVFNQHYHHGMTSDQTNFCEVKL